MKFVFWIAITIGIAFHAITLPYSSNHWQDEGQICEIGRRVLEKTDWNMYLLPGKESNTVAPGIWFVGPVAQECSYRLVGHLGPKIMTLVFLALATIMVYCFSMLKTGDEHISLLSALLFFTTPVLVQSARGARADVMGFAFLFASLVCFEKSLKSEDWLVKCMWCFFAGILCAVCFGTWGSCLLLMPIVWWEMVEIMYQASWGRGLRLGIMAVCGGMLGLLIVEEPFWAQLPLSAKCLMQYLSVVGNHEVFEWKALLASFFAPPYVYLIGLLCLLMTRRVWLIMGVLVYFIVCAKNGHIYVFRTLYFLPYSIVALVLLGKMSPKGLVRKLCVPVIAVLTMGLFIRSVAIRNIVEWMASPSRSYASLYDVLKREIGLGVKIYNGDWQTYFVGRELGWKQYQIYSANQQFDYDIFDDVDYVLVSEGHKEGMRFLTNRGFSKNKVLTVPSTGVVRMQNFLKRHRWLHALGPYVLLSKEVDGAELDSQSAKLEIIRGANVSSL